MLVLMLLVAMEYNSVHTVSPSSVVFDTEATST
jgi:hypothetical protein